MGFPGFSMGFPMVFPSVPATLPRRVVFPEPLGPMTPVRRPGEAMPVTFFKMLVLPMSKQISVFGSGKKFDGKNRWRLQGMIDL